MGSGSRLFLAPMRFITHPPAPRRFVGMLAMHHIYCPNKIAFIENQSANMHLAGVRLYGKPGRVIVEGDSEGTVRKYMGAVRKLRWQKCVEMGVFPVEEVLNEETLINEFDFTTADILAVRWNKSASSAAISTAKIESTSTFSSVDGVPRTKNPDEVVRHFKDGDIDEDGNYIRVRVRPTAFIFPSQRPIVDSRKAEHDTEQCSSLLEATSEDHLRSLLEERGAASLWKHINAPFSGPRHAYSKVELYNKCA